MSSCAICLEAELRTPAACVPCGHTFCHACITQWTSAPSRFRVSLCPQCRVPVREVQKLFISDWPVAVGSGAVGAPQQMSPWQQFLQLLTLFTHFLSIPLNAVAIYGPGIRAQLTAWFNQQLIRATVLKTQILRYAAIGYREWLDLGLPAQCLVGGAFLLVAMLLLQDLQDEDGIHRGIVLPILLVLVNMVKQLSVAAAYILYRPLACLATCLGQVVLAVSDVSGVVARALLWTSVDLFSIPWLLLRAVARVVLAGMALVAGCVRVVVFILAACLLLGVPAFLASPNHQGAGRWMTALADLGQEALEWLRLKLQFHRQRAAATAATAAAHRGPATREPEGHTRRNTHLREIFMLLSANLQNEAQRVLGERAQQQGSGTSHREEGRAVWQGQGDTGRQEERRRGGDDEVLWQWDDAAQSLGGDGERPEAGQRTGLGDAEERHSVGVRLRGGGQDDEVAEWEPEDFWRNFFNVT